MPRRAQHDAKRGDRPAAGRPPAQGLYDPRFEHDACGVGFVCRMRGEPSHAIVADGLRILRNLTHRGATGSDARTGDGAGILMQLPDAFLRAAADAEGIRLPEPGAYGAGLVFLPPDPAQRAEVEATIARVIRAEGQSLLGWRDVPVRPECLGDIAREAAPCIRQVFVGRAAGPDDAATFERRLFVVRKTLERVVRESGLAQRGFFYIPSLSARTLIYKGLLLAEQIEDFFPDLADERMVSRLALVHQRYSTNTFPTWDLAQPFRFLCHNGEINTLRGNVNMMRAREGLFASPLFGADMAKLFPVIPPGASDSAALDNAVELLTHTGRSLPHAVMMLIPEAWEHHPGMSESKRAFYEYHACLTEPWDGPASVPFTDGRCIGAVLDRNGLRPSRYTVTRDGRVILGSETGVLDVAPEDIVRRGRLEPGRMLLVDLEAGRIVEDEELKEEMAARRPYAAWLRAHRRRLGDLPPGAEARLATGPEVLQLERAFGYTAEDRTMILGPMAVKGEEPTGSMGTDTPLAVLSERPQPLFDYFHQLFAQVTNPPLDALREEAVTSLHMFLGAEGDLFEETPKHCARLRVESPILTGEDLERIRALDERPLRARTLPMLFPAGGDGAALGAALDALCAEADAAVDAGCSLLILSDRGVDAARAPIPSLLAVGAVNHHLIRGLRRTRASLIVESGEPRETHHLALLFGFGAAAVNPYLAFDAIQEMVREGLIADVDVGTALDRYRKALAKGVLKIMSKMGISTLRSYCGAQIFEAVGLSSELVERCFAETPSRLEGIGLDGIAAEAAARHAHAFPEREMPEDPELTPGGHYQWRRNGEPHLLDPFTIARLQQAVRADDPQAYAAFAAGVNEAQERCCTPRALLRFRAGADPVPLDEVEPWTAIVRRFKTGAMSYGSISREAHETLALAMNRLGGRSNSGEGGEDPERFGPDPRGGWRRSAIKQVASGRFGVTSHYLVNARELQIKMAQGAKPGEGGQLPGFKVYPWIARTRHSTPYVTLISPPPHHDIYSIEDLAQLIHDLKNANPEARVDVKLVSEVGVGTVAAGVAKGKADVVLISGYDGGTGASPLSSIKHAGLPWELGLAETHQTLVLNDLRSRIVIECDGKLLTGRDVAVACLLGAEEFGFSAGPLVSLGCIMMRVCHLNTCPVGIATQDPELRRKFSGKPEHVVRYFRFVAEELRRIMAELGFRTMDEMVGRADRLEPDSGRFPPKARGLDLAPLLAPAAARPGVGIRCTEAQEHGLDRALDHELIRRAEPALERAEPVAFDIDVRNVNRTFGTMLSGRISAAWGEEGLPEDTIAIRAFGAGGQSFGAFAAPGLTIRLEGDANDYFGKGLSGGRLIVVPPRAAPIRAEEHILIGNVALYGATRGEAFIRGRAGERFAVRNSGVRAVVEGVGDHGCEYMTGGRVAVLGPTGRNFAAGMSGGIAYVFDEAGDFARLRCNPAMVELEPLEDPADEAELRALVERHRALTESAVAARLLDDWDAARARWVKVMPVDYRRALAILASEAAGAAAD